MGFESPNLTWGCLRAQGLPFALVQAGTDATMSCASACELARPLGRTRERAVPSQSVPSFESPAPLAARVAPRVQEGCFGGPAGL